MRQVMRSTVARTILIMCIPLGVIFLYALVHEGAHALFVLLFGGTVTEFQVNFFAHSPHVSYEGVYNPLHRAFISLAGPVLPLILVLPLTVLMRRMRNIMVQGTILLFLGSLVPTVLVSAVVSLAYGFGFPQSTEDVAKFLQSSGFNPYVVSGMFLLVYGALLVFVVRVGKAKDVAVGVVNSLRGTTDKRRTAVVGRVFAVMLLLAVCAGILRNVVGRETKVHQPVSYHTKLDVRLEDIDVDSTIYHVFEVTQPTTYDFVYSLETQSDVTLRLLNLQGEPFVFNNQDSIIMYQGRENLPLASFSGFMLLEGTYALGASEGSRGSLTMYIDSREPNTVDLQYTDLLTKAREGTFTSQSYQEEGYALIYEGPVLQGPEQTLVTFPDGGRGRKISAFVVGSGDVSLFYEADGNTYTLLEGFRATMGRGLPAHRDQGEIHVKVLDGEAMLYIYVNDKE